MAIINSDPNVIEDVAENIRSSFMQICSDTEILDAELSKLSCYIDDEAYFAVCQKVKSLITKLDDSTESAVSIYSALLEYADIIREGKQIK